jgi:hypothetical protein
LCTSRPQADLACGLWLSDIRHSDIDVRLLICYSCYTHPMSKRLQVLLSDQEMSRLKEAAQKAQLSVGEWVRQAIRKNADGPSPRPADEKLKAVRRALSHSFPTANIDEMNREIEQGYTHGLP